MKAIDWLIFLGLLALIVITYDFSEIYNLRPQGQHIWRQTDCASLALNYHQDEDASFFSPRTHHLMGKNHDGKTMGELPIIYYTVSKLYDIFGFHEGIFRCFNFLIFAIGLLFLFKLSLSYLKDKILASVVVLSATCSVIVIFYAYSFMPNSPALGLSFCSWYYIYEYFKKGRKRYLFYFIAFISLAALLKITALLSAGIVMALFIFERFFKIQYRIKALFNLRNMEGLYLVIPFVMAWLWILVAHVYQTKHGNFYFSLDWDPIWVMEDHWRTYTWNRLTSDWGWKRDITYPAIMFLSMVSFALAWIEKNKFWAHVLSLYLFAVAAYVIVFFMALTDHDYYMINLTGYFPLSFLFLAKWVGRNYKKSIGAYIFFGILMVAAITSTDRRHKDRYTDFPYDDRTDVFFEMTPYIRSIGIKPEDKIIVEGERSHCVSLYLLNNKGWNNYLNENKKEAEDDRFLKFKSWGAKYLLVLGEDRLQYKSIRDLKKKQIGQYENVFIFELLD